MVVSWRFLLLFLFNLVAGLVALLADVVPFLPQSEHVQLELTAAFSATDLFLPPTLQIIRQS